MSTSLFRTRKVHPFFVTIGAWTQSEGGKKEEIGEALKHFALCFETLRIYMELATLFVFSFPTAQREKVRQVEMKRASLLCLRVLGLS